MLVWMAVNQVLAVGPSLHRSTTVCWPSGEWSSNSLDERKGNHQLDQTSIIMITIKGHFL